MKNTPQKLALLLFAALFLISAMPASALFGKKEAAVDPHAPVLQDQEITTYGGIPYCGTFTAEDDEEGAVTYAVVKEPKKGSVSVTGEEFVYTPEEKKTGHDSFTVTATDADGNVSAPATVRIDILKRETTVTYSDMTAHSSYFAAISLAERGIYEGRSVAGQRYFEPESEVTRSEFLAMAMKAADITVFDNVEVTGFADDAAIPTWVKGCASAAAREGIVSGIVTEEGLSFCGDEPISLKEAAAVLDRLLDVADVALEEEQGDWAAQAVANMEAAQVIAAGSFGSENAVRGISRGEAAEMLSAAMMLLEKEEKPVFRWIG